MKHHLSSTIPHLLFLTETQLSVTTDSSPFSVPSYFVYPHFQCSRVQNLESFEFSTIWLRLQYHSLTKIICDVYLSLNSSDYVKFFDYLTSKVEYIHSLFLCWNIHLWGFQCSPPALTFIFFHWQAWWTNLQLCYPSWPRATGAIPYLYLWPPWGQAKHSWSFPNFQPFSLLY